MTDVVSFQMHAFGLATIATMANGASATIVSTPITVVPTRFYLLPINRTTQDPRALDNLEP